MQKVLISGGDGQLGRELQLAAPKDIGVFAYGAGELNLVDPKAVDLLVAEIQPDIVINAAAYTLVDQAETESAKAFAINAEGVVNLAKAARDCGAKFIHFSTDFIFDGKKSTPYLCDDPPNPLGVYGASKLEGEKRLRQIMAEEDMVILRTSWLYSVRGNNFVTTMLRLMGERDELQIVSDQVGSPTWAKPLAGAIWSIVEKKLCGIYHWTDAGVASWYDFACAIYEEAKIIGLVSREVKIIPVNHDLFPLPAQRPAYSVLAKEELWGEIGYRSEHWREALRKMLREMADRQSCDGK